MPELPEVETTLKGISPYILNQKIIKVIVRHPKLRWPIPKNLKEQLINKKIRTLQRRGKYLLLGVKEGTLILHLGMSGSLRLLRENRPAQKHDHFELAFSNKIILRFTDPRRFGAVLWTDEAISDHPLLKNLGPEPLSPAFSTRYLCSLVEKSHVPIKTFLMNGKVVVGVGNIYAAEALHLANINPGLLAYRLSFQQVERLVKAVKMILRQAIKQGGTTLKDFLQSDGKPGYFSHFLNVYGRAGLPCKKCQAPLKSIILNQRSTVFCEMCQK